MHLAKNSANVRTVPEALGQMERQNRKHVGGIVGYARHRNKIPKEQLKSRITTVNLIFLQTHDSVFPVLSICSTVTEHGEMCYVAGHGTVCVIFVLK